MTDKIKQGEQAERILKDPLIEGFFTEFERYIFERWATTSDVVNREEVYRLKVAGDAFKEHLRTYILTGELARKQEEEANG